MNTDTTAQLSPEESKAADALLQDSELGGEAIATLYKHDGD